MSDLTPDDFWQKDETDELAEQIADSVAEHVDVPDAEVPDDVATTDDLPEVPDVDASVEKALKEYLGHHIPDEACDDPHCEKLRDALGVDPTGGGTPEDDSDDSGDSGDSDSSDGSDDSDSSADDGDSGDGEPSNVAFEDSL